MSDTPQIEDFKRVYVLWANTDTNEGRGWEVPIGACETLATAHRLAKGQNVQGSPAHIREGWAIKVDGQWLIPGTIKTPTRDDVEVQKTLDMKQEVYNKAKAAGLTDDELLLLKS